jgi:hypothetical protein
MAKHVVNKTQFSAHVETPTFEGDPRSIPPEFGTQPVPAGHVRFHHYTKDPANLPSIREHGLQRSRAAQDYEPYVFMTAGAPSEDFKHGHVFVEGHASANTFQQGGQLDIGRWGGEHGDLGKHIEHMESRRNTITALGDIPASQIIGAHEPWHEHARYMAREGIGERTNPKDPYATGSMRSQIARGEYEYLHEKQFAKTYGPALKSVKVTNAATVMLGGKL